MQWVRLADLPAAKRESFLKLYGKRPEIRMTSGRTQVVLTSSYPALAAMPEAMIRPRFDVVVGVARVVPVSASRAVALTAISRSDAAGRTVAYQFNDGDAPRVYILSGDRVAMGFRPGR